jgi:hypothetical protein
MPRDLTLIKNNQVTKQLLGTYTRKQEIKPLVLCAQKPQNNNEIKNLASLV